MTSQVEREIELVDQLFQSYADLIETVRHTKPDLVRMTAVASVVHSFYNGLETIFTRIAKGVDHEVPAGEDSHQALLRQMAEPRETRSAVLSEDTAKELAKYLGFRHFYRHSYSFALDWGQLGRLVMPLPELWQAVKIELRSFLGLLGGQDD